MLKNYIHLIVVCTHFLFDISSKIEKILEKFGKKNNIYLYNNFAFSVFRSQRADLLNSRVSPWQHVRKHVIKRTNVYQLL